MSIAATACGKRNFLLLFEVTLLTFIALYLHAYGYSLATYGKSNKVSQTIPVLYNRASTTRRATSYSFFCLYMQDNSITFVFFTSAFVGVKSPKYDIGNCCSSLYIYFCLFKYTIFTAVSFLIL